MENMAIEPRFHVANTKVAHEIIDGEAVVIHLETGHYYSLTGLSAQLWQWFAAGASRGQILDALDPLTEQQVASVDQFIHSLVAEGILEPGAGAAESGPLPKYGAAFEAPAFAKYNDMQNLLLSDPIHDVDETGWPHLDPGAV
jgi:hypothetical protein